MADHVTLASAIFHTLAKINSPFFVEVLRGTSLGPANSNFPGVSFSPLGRKHLCVLNTITLMKLGF